MRSNPAVGEKVLAFLKDHTAKSVVVTDGIIGCPHEEGIDYPEGKSCPQCPSWAGRDQPPRFVCYVALPTPDSGARV